MQKRSKKKKPLTQIKPPPKSTTSSSITPCIFINTVLNERWKIIDKLGQGSFGVIYMVEDLLYKDTKPKYAIKIENLSVLHLNYSLLQKESRILIKLESEPGFPKLIKIFPEYCNNCLVMSLLGDNLSLLMKKCQGNFSLRTVLMLGVTMLTRLESLHSKGLLHRDIKPENACIGIGNEYNLIYLIDFGLSKPFLENNGTHIPLIEKKGLVGTARYASINAHMGYELSRRDDLESLMYMLVYLARGTLPWQNLISDSKDAKYGNIFKMKQNIKEEVLCEGLPLEFNISLKYIKTLQFEENPNYKFLKGLFTKMLEEKDVEFEPKYYDWTYLYDKNTRPPIYSEQTIENIETAICQEKKVVVSLTNLNLEANLKVFPSIFSLGTSKMAHFSKCDLEEGDLEEREINRFWKNEVFKPKFLMNEGD